MHFCACNILMSQFHLYYFGIVKNHDCHFAELYCIFFGWKNKRLLQCKKPAWQPIAKKNGKSSKNTLEVFYSLMSDFKKNVPTRVFE